MGLLFWLLEQIHTTFPQRKGGSRARGAETDCGGSSVCRGNFKNGHNKLLDVKEQMTLTMKLKFIRNREMLKVTNSTQKKVTFDPTDMVGVVGFKISRIP